MKKALAELSRLGLVETFAVGIKLFCGLTPKGAAHPDYDLNASKVMPVDLVSEIGEINSKYLQAMRVLGGTARTIELTYALTEASGARSGSGQIMQKLEQVGLVQRVKNKALRQNSHSLTETGRRIAVHLDEHIDPPERRSLEASIKRRMEERASTLRRNRRDDQSAEKGTGAEVNNPAVHDSIGAYLLLKYQHGLDCGKVSTLFACRLINQHFKIRSISSAFNSRYGVRDVLNR